MTGLSAVNCPNGTLAAGASETCSATYTTTQTDVDAGGITNTGTASGTPSSGPAVAASARLTIPAIDTPNVGVIKSASIASFSAPGIAVTYSYQVTNAGNVDLNPVAVTDPMPNLSAISCPVTALAPGASETCSATYTTTQADVDAGGISNTGTASGTPPSGSNVTASSTLTIPAVDTPSIRVIKSANITSYSAAGTAVTYSYQVTNTGNVDLNPVTVKDPMVGLSAISCPVTALAPAASETCSATYTTTQADVSAGSIKNTGTATGAPKTGANATATSTLTIPYQAPLTLSVTPNSLPFGTLYRYSGELKTVTVKNTGGGAVSITGVSVTPGADTDPYEFVPVSLCPRSLGVGKSCLIAIVLLADDLGAHSATLNIADSAAGSPEMVPMSATVIKRSEH
jgi:uncharacterized repeat protein (TIGR01451 family)